MSEAAVTAPAQPDWTTWAGLWWGHVWRYFWRGMLLVLATGVVFMMAGALFKLLRIDFMLIFFVPVMAAVFLWWCFKNYIYALDAMMLPEVSFGGYRLRFMHNALEETVTSRLRAMRWLSWGMIWRNFLWALPVAIVDETFSRFVLPKLLPPDPTQSDMMAYYSPVWVVMMVVYALIWIYVLKGRLGKEIKGYTLYLLPAVAQETVIVPAVPAEQTQWGGKS